MRINEKIKFLKEKINDGLGNYQTNSELEELLAVTRDTTLDNKSRRKLNVEHLISVFKIPMTVREINILFNLGFLSDIDDIFKLKLRKDEIQRILGKDEQSMNRIINMIEDIKSAEPHEILLGISCGTLKAYMAKKIVSGLDNLSGILNISDEKLVEYGMYLPQINFVKSQFRYIERIKLLDRFMKCGVIIKITNKPHIPKIGVERIKLFSGKKFLLLETYANFVYSDIDELEKYIKKLNGEICCCIDNTIDYVISNKVLASVRKKLSPKCKVLTEDQFHILVSTITMEKLLDGEI